MQTRRRGQRKTHTDRYIITSVLIAMKQLGCEHYTDGQSRLGEGWQGSGACQGKSLRGSKYLGWDMKDKLQLVR